MAKKIFTFRGKTLEELQNIPTNEFYQLLPARERRTVARGFTDPEKIFLKQVEAGAKNLKTHCRNIIITPNMVGMVISLHRGNTFDPITIQPEMIGQRIGSFALTRKRLQHSAPGVGATKSSVAISAK